MTIATEAGTAHDTIVMERTYKASPQRVFAAWASVEARERWSPPSPEIRVVYDSHNFRVGGIDVVRCGESGDMRFLAHVWYADIIPDRRIVMAERVSEAGKRVSAALITVELRPSGRDTLLALTLQITAIDGSDMLAGYRQGWGAALDNLASEFNR
jgi:uncharacterized protein YndB with AHSA1/START domain